MKWTVKKKKDKVVQTEKKTAILYSTTYMSVFRSYTNEKNNKTAIDLLLLLLLSQWTVRLCIFTGRLCWFCLFVLKWHLSEKIWNWFAIMCSTNSFRKHHRYIDYLEEKVSWFIFERFILIFFEPEFYLNFSYFLLVESCSSRQRLRTESYLFSIQPVHWRFHAYKSHRLYSRLHSAI